MEPELLLLDKSALLGTRLADIDRTLAISPTLWAEVWTGNQNRRQDCLRALDENLTRSVLLFQFETLIQDEVFWRRPTGSLIDQDSTSLVRNVGSFGRLQIDGIADIEKYYSESARLMWEHVQLFTREVLSRLEQGDQRLLEFLRDTNPVRRYETPRDRALPRRVFDALATEARFPQQYDSLDDRWLVRNYCNAMAFTIWDEVRIRHRVQTLRPPERFRRELMDVQHMALAGIVGAIATRDKRMHRRLRALNPNIEVVAGTS